MTAGLYLHALRVARPRQVIGRLARPVRRRRFGAPPPRAFHPLSKLIELWRSAAFEPARLAGDGRERLRDFHAAYGDDVLAHARAGDVDAAAAALHAWIRSYPAKPGDAWHPYPTSTRAANWIAALSLEPSLASADVVESLWHQLHHVKRNVEDDVLGNHVIRNARALVLGGVSFADDVLLERGLGLLRRELPEQVLPDGGHYERSPVYHLVVLRDLLEVEAARPGTAPVGVLDRMRRFAAALARPDGAPALFNDGSLELAPRLQLPPAREGLSVFPDTGYAVVRTGDVWLAFDCGPPGPDFLPAHAHADALSFQLWWRERPVVVDPGTYTYEPGADRDWFRGTRAHSTVAVDGRDQFRLWGAFRSGPLPRVELLEASETRLRGAVTLGPVRHVRSIELAGNEIVVTDTLEGSGTHRVVSVLPLAAGATAEIVGLGGLTVTREERWISERFFVRERGVAEVQNGELQLPTTIGWALRLA